MWDIQRINNNFINVLSLLPLLLGIILSLLQVSTLLLRPYRSYYASPYLDYLDLGSSLRRSRLAADIAVTSIATENALRRSRIETDIALSRIGTENVLRRSRLAAELEVSRIDREINLRDSLRRLRAENEVDRILTRY